MNEWTKCHGRRTVGIFSDKNHTNLPGFNFPLVCIDEIINEWRNTCRKSHWMRGLSNMRNNFLLPYKFKPEDESSWLLLMPCPTCSMLDMERLLLNSTNTLIENVWKNSFVCQHVQCYSRGVKLHVFFCFQKPQLQV